MVNKSKDYQNRRWRLVSSGEITAALVQLLMAAFPEPEHTSPALSIYILPPAVHQAVLEIQALSWGNLIRLLSVVEVLCVSS